MRTTITVATYDRMTNMHREMFVEWLHHHGVTNDAISHVVLADNQFTVYTVEGINSRGEVEYDIREHAVLVAFPTELVGYLT